MIWRCGWPLHALVAVRLSLSTMGTMGTRSKLSISTRISLTTRVERALNPMYTKFPALAHSEGPTVVLMQGSAMRNMLRRLAMRRQVATWRPFSWSQACQWEVLSFPPLVICRLATRQCVQLVVSVWLMKCRWALAASESTFGHSNSRVSCLTSSQWASPLVMVCRWQQWLRQGVWLNLSTMALSTSTPLAGILSAALPGSPFWTFSRKSAYKRMRLRLERICESGWLSWHRCGHSLVMCAVVASLLEWSSCAIRLHSSQQHRKHQLSVPA